MRRFFNSLLGLVPSDGINSSGYLNSEYCECREQIRENICCVLPGSYATSYVFDESLLKYISHELADNECREGDTS